MTVERAGGVFDAGADIVSVVTDITLHDNPELRLMTGCVQQDDTL